MKHCAHYTMDEPWKQHVWWKKPDTKGHITCQSVCTKLQVGHTDRREQARGFQAWVREGVGTAEARPGSGTGWGPGRLGLGQGGRGDRRGSAWGRDGVGTPVAVRTSSH